MVRTHRRTDPHGERPEPVCPPKVVELDKGHDPFRHISLPHRCWAETLMEFPDSSELGWRIQVAAQEDGHRRLPESRLSGFPFALPSRGEAEEGDMGGFPVSIHNSKRTFGTFDVHHEQSVGAKTAKPREIDSTHRPPAHHRERVFPINVPPGLSRSDRFGRTRLSAKVLLQQDHVRLFLSDQIDEPGMVAGGHFCVEGHHAHVGFARPLGFDPCVPKRRSGCSEDHACADIPGHRLAFAEVLHGDP